MKENPNLPQKKERKKETIEIVIKEPVIFRREMKEKSKQ